MLRAKKMTKRFVFFPTFLISILLNLPCKATTILKVKGKQALVESEDLKFEAGSYFDVYNLKGKAVGLLEIKKAGRQKAIGIIKIGRGASGYSLEPRSRKSAMAIERKYLETKEKRMRLVQEKRRAEHIRKQKIARAKRNEALRKQRQEAYRRRMALLKSREKRTRRGIANYNKSYDDLTEDDTSTGYDDAGNEDSYSDREYYGDSMDYEALANTRKTRQRGRYQHRKKPRKQFSSLYDSYGGIQLGDMNVGMGITPEIKLDIFRLKLTNVDLVGPGYGLSGFIDIGVLNFLKIHLSLGYSWFNAISKKSCGGRSVCGVQIHHLLAGSGTKFVIKSSNIADIWLGLNGKLLYPFSYINKANLGKNSFNLHGTMGFMLGSDLKFGSFSLFPSIYIDVFIPPGKTTFITSSGLKLGFGFNL